MNLQIIMAKARDYRRQGDMGLWGLCLLASRVIDKARYGDGAVIDFAQAVKRTGKTIYNFAGAWETYISLRREFETNFKMWPQVKRFQNLRAELPYTHFRAMGELMRRFEFSPTEAIGYLVDAMEQGYSADRMTKDVEAEQDGNHKPPSKAEVFEKRTSQAVYALEEATMNTDDQALVSVLAQAAAAVRAVIEPKQKEPPWFQSARLVRQGALSLARLDSVPPGLSDALLALADVIGQAMEA
jgi:hypothetical protein